MTQPAPKEFELVDPEASTQRPLELVEGQADIQQPETIEGIRSDISELNPEKPDNINGDENRPDTSNEETAPEMAPELVAQFETAMEAVRAATDADQIRKLAELFAGSGLLVIQKMKGRGWIARPLKTKSKRQASKMLCNRINNKKKFLLEKHRASEIDKATEQAKKITDPRKLETLAYTFTKKGVLTKQNFENGGWRVEPVDGKGGEELAKALNSRRKELREMKRNSHKLRANIRDILKSK